MSWHRMRHRISFGIFCMWRYLVRMRWHRWLEIIPKSDFSFDWHWLCHCYPRDPYFVKIVVIIWFSGRYRVRLWWTKDRWRHTLRSRVGKLLGNFRICRNAIPPNLGHLRIWCLNWSSLTNYLQSGHFV